MEEDLNKEYNGQYVVDSPRSRDREDEELDDIDKEFIDDDDVVYPFYPQPWAPGWESDEEDKKQPIVIDLTQDEDEVGAYIDIDEDVDVDDHAFNIEEKKDWEAEYPQDGKRYYRWCMTVWATDAWPTVESLYDYILEKNLPLKYIVGQTEIAPSTGNRHLQVYLEWKNNKSFSAMKRLFIRTWLGVPNGTAMENKRYCTKGDSAVPNTIFEWGLPGEEAQGKRSDLKDLCDAIIAAPSRTAMREIVMSNPVAYVRNHRGIEKLNSFNWKNSRVDPYICTVNGAPRAGKSRAVRALEPFLYNKRRGQWWDNYTGQPAVAIDEFHLQADDTPLDEMLNVCDGIPHMEPTKGSHTDLNFERLYLISHRPFETILEQQAQWSAIFAFDPLQKLALVQRIHARATITCQTDANGTTTRHAVIQRLLPTVVPAGWIRNWDNAGLNSVTFDNSVIPW